MVSLSKIDQFYSEVFQEKDILRLEIQMNDFVQMQEP